MKLFSPAFSPANASALGPLALLACAIILTFVLSSRRRPREIRSLTRRRLGVTYGIARWGVIATLAIVAMIFLGFDLQGIWSTVVAVLSLVAIGFVAMWSILSHMLASLLIVLFRPFDVGSQIEIVGDDPVLGEVHDLPIATSGFG